MHRKPRLLRITTAAISLKLLLRGQVTYFQQHGFEVLTVSAGGREVNDLKSEGIPHQVVPMTRTITPLRDVYCLVVLIRIIARFKPDIVHTHTPKAGLLGMMAAWISRVPVRMHTVAGLPLMEATGLKHSILLLTERITYRCASGVYPNSKGLMKFIDSKFKIQHSKFHMIGNGSSNGIDAQHFSRTSALAHLAKDIRSRFQIPDHAIVFSFVGRIVKDKGVVELVSAFQKISIDVPVYLMLVGPYEQELDPLPAQTMQFIEHSPQVIKAGFQNDVRPWLLASDVFVFPSYREGFPNVVMQAACLEVPSIVSDINGCNEIIRDNESGLIVPVKNENALYGAMLRLSNDQGLRASLAKKSREYVATHFDQRFVWEELLKEYVRLVKSEKLKV